MNNAKKTFISGLNADASNFAHKKEDLVDALNARVILSSEGKSGSLSNITGNRLISNPYLESDSKVVGSFEDVSNNDIYYFTSSSVADKIFVYKNSLNAVYLVLSETDLQDYSLGFSNNPITGISVIDGLLYWTGGQDKEPCRINVDRGIKIHHSSYSSTQVAYTTPIQKSVVTIIRKPPMLPPEVEAQVDTSRDTSFLKPQAHTFAFRYKYKDGETSVFSPSSEFYPHQNMDDANHKLTRKINIKFPELEKIEQDVEKIQLAVKFDNDTSYFIIHEFDDETSFASHNGGTANLEYNYYNDVLGNAVSDSNSVKLYDTVPHEAEALTIARNRLFLGNFKTGRLNPRKATSSDMVLTLRTEPTPDQTTLLDVDRTNGGILGFSHSSAYQVGIAFYDFAGRTGGVLTSDDFKVITPERDLNLLTYIDSILWQLPNSAKTLIPSWATHYSIVRTKNLTKDFTLGNLINKIRYYTNDSNGNFTIRVEKEDDNGDPTGKFSDQELITFNGDYEGVAIGLGDLTSYKLGYSYQEGDRIKIITNSQVFDFAISAQRGRYVLINLVDLNSAEYLGTGNLSSLDYDFVYEIYSPHKQTSVEYFYETKHRYKILNPGTSDKGFQTTSGLLSGDVYLKKRKADTSTDETVVKEHHDWTQNQANDGLKGLRKYIGLPIFYGTGLNDISIPEHSTSTASNYTGTDDLRYEIIIDATGSPDTFKWRAFSGTTASGSYTTGVSITGASQTLSNGVAIQFAATTGHTVNDRWVVTAKSQYGDGNTQLNDQGNSYPRFAYSFFEGLPNETIPAGSEVKFEFEESREYNQTHTATITADEVTKNYANLEEFLYEGGFIQRLGVWHTRLSFRRGELSSFANGGYSQIKVLGNEDSNGTTHHPSTNDGFSTHIIIKSVGDQQGTFDGRAELKTTITINFPDSYGYNAEAMNPSDDYFLRWTQITGRPNLVFEDLDEEEKTTGIVFSETKVPGSKINGLSKFSALDETQLDEVTGKLRKLILTSKTQSTGTVLLALSENETTSIYLGEQQLQGASDGSQFLAVSNNVIGTKNTLQGSFGTINPESVVASEGNAYWYDAKNATAVKYTNQGLVPIGDVKMKTFFKGRNKAVLVGGNVFGTYDVYNNEYILNMPPVTGSVATVILQEDAFFESTPSLTYNQSASNLSNLSTPVQIGSPWNVLKYVTFSNGVGTFTFDNEYRFRFNSPIVSDPTGTNISVVNASSGGFTTESESGYTYHKTGTGSLTISNVQDNVGGITLSLTRSDGAGDQNIFIKNKIRYYENTLGPFDTPVRVTGATQTTSLTEQLSNQAVSSGSINIPCTASVAWKLGSTAVNTGFFYRDQEGTFTEIPVANISTNATAIASIGYQPGSFNITISGITENMTGVEINSRPLTNSTVTTEAKTSLSSTGFTMNGNFTSAGDGTVSSKGFVYSNVVSVPEIGDDDVTNQVVSGTSTGTFNHTLTGLSNSTTYYYRAYVISNIGTVYGAVETVTTLSPSVSLPTVSTGSATSITSTGATLGGSITANGGATITAKGIVVSLNSTNSNPEIGGTGVTNLQDTGTIGTLPYSISKNSTGLTAGSQYAFKAYATNAAGTAYGSAQTFTTSSNTATLQQFRAAQSTVDADGGNVALDFTKTGSGVLSGTATVQVEDGLSLLSEFETTFNISIGSSQTTQTVNFYVGAYNASTSSSRTLTFSITQLTGMSLTSGSLPKYSTQVVTQQGNGNIQ